jgi:short-subunit dehydrogenase
MEDESVCLTLIRQLPLGVKFDFLIFVAGYFTTETFEELNFKEGRKMMEICAFAPLRIIQGLVLAGYLSEGSKIGMITSEGGSIGLRTEREGGANYGHHMSKCAQVNLLSNKSLL